MSCLMNMKIVLACVSIFMVFGTLYGQRKKVQDTSARIFQPSRIEFAMDDYSLDYQVVNGDSDGLLVLQPTNDRLGDGYQWVFHYVDTLLNRVWNRTLSIPFEAYLVGTEYHDGKFYLLYNTSRYRSEELMILEIGIDDGVFVKYEISTVFPIQLTFFEVLGEHIIFAGYTNYRPVILTFDLHEEIPRVVPGFYDSNSDILDIIIDDDAQMFTVIQSERMNNRKQTVRAKTFTAAGDLVQSNTVTPGDKKNLVDGASTSFYGGFQYIAGTYSKKSSQYSRGLYLSKFVNGRQQFVKYHEYADLNNFFGYMNRRREKRIKDRIERKKGKGKKPQFSYRLLVHDIIQRDDEYLLIAEAYYPRYSNSTNSNGPGGWNGYGRYNPSFMGYKYTHAIVVSFDRNGNIIWDNSFEINDLESYGLKEFVAVNTYEDHIVLMYLEENTIRSKVIQDDEIVEGKTFNPVRLSFVDDQVKSKNPELEELDVWYDKTMYAYGEQRIYNENGAGGKLSRRVFYINKIQYDATDATNEPFFPKEKP